MTNRTLLKVGVTGTVSAALCCFTPVLVVLFGIAGLSAFTGMLDYVLLPALGMMSYCSANAAIVAVDRCIAVLTA